MTMMMKSRALFHACGELAPGSPRCQGWWSSPASAEASSILGGQPQLLQGPQVGEPARSRVPGTCHVLPQTPLKKAVY